MKKIIIALFFLVSTLGITHVNAQTKPTDKKPAKTVAVKAKESTPKDKSLLKKDGTPDMRMKENKEAAKAKPSGPLKKDGTADMRYKTNKDKVKAKK
jgi:hypothetical protein